MAARARPGSGRRTPARPDRGRPPVLGRRTGAPSVADGWRAQPPAIRVLRAFLGVTFVYAGINKLADPNFFHPGSFDYIGQQLQRFAEGSPIAPLIRFAAHAPVLTGVVIALVELAVGVGTLLGIAPATAAIVGLVVNLILFLSATWHVHPYFLGSDSIYAVAWAAYLVAVIDARRRADPPEPLTRRQSLAAAAELRRREFLRGGALAASTLFLAGMARAVAGAPSRTSGGGNLASRSSGGTPKRSFGSGSSNGSSNGTPIAALSSIPVGGAIGFNAANGDPAVLLRPSQDTVVAYSRICTHAGCLVGYDQRDQILVCPCHGAEFDPNKGAAVIAGPAPTPLRKIPVAIDHSSGQVVAT